MFLFSFLSRENRGKVKENYFHESLTELQKVQCLLQFNHKVRFYIALSTEGKMNQLVQWNIFIQREVNNPPNLPREDWPPLYSCICFRGSKASNRLELWLDGCKKSICSAEKNTYIPTWQHRVWEKEPPSFLPSTVGIPDCADARFGSHLCYTFD